ncbi:MAG: TraR/DksA C4-type zinc finger protein [Gemmatimonadota bacterium]|nr:TraR/DksA C4-type zinc finger protein [Gemmatimonadota bacterium]
MADERRDRAGGEDEEEEKRERVERDAREIEDEEAKRIPGRAGEKTTRREPGANEDAPPGTREPTLETEPDGAWGEGAGKREKIDRGDAFYERFRKRLLEERVRVSQRLDELREELAELDESTSRELEERAQEEKDRDILLRLEERETDELKRIRTALELIDAREYGVCRACGRKIPKNRLEELPTTFRCVHCST